MATDEPTKRGSAGSGPIRVLIVDNEAAHAHAVAESLDRVGYDCSVATSGPQGIKQIDQGEFDLVITDLVMNEVDGLAVLKHAKEKLPDAEVILVTGHGTIPSAVAAMQQGAFNYLLKPLDLGQLRTVAERATESWRLRRQNVELNRRLDERLDRLELACAAMWSLLKDVHGFTDEQRFAEGLDPRHLWCAVTAGISLCAAYLPVPAELRTPYLEALAATGRYRGIELIMGDFNTDKNGPDTTLTRGAFPCGHLLDRLAEAGYTDLWRDRHPEVREYSY